jgi:hypothetical protein
MSRRDPVIVAWHEVPGKRERADRPGGTAEACAGPRGVSDLQFNGYLAKRSDEAVTTLILPLTPSRAWKSRSVPACPPWSTRRLSFSWKWRDEGGMGQSKDVRTLLVNDARFGRPSGTVHTCPFFRHFVPGYFHQVPPGHPFTPPPFHPSILPSAPPLPSPTQDNGSCFRWICFARPEKIGLDGLITRVTKWLCNTRY